MTDDLVVRLRCYPANRLCRQVADALEAQARRIAELEAALKPFADEADTYNRRDDARDHIDQCGGLTVADLRAARAAYLGEKHDNE